MHKSNNVALSRRQTLQWTLAGLGVGAGALPWVGVARADDHQPSTQRGTAAPALASPGLRGRVVVVGGGMAGAAAAKYLRMWGGADLEVVLVEPEASYISNIMSNLVLNGARTTSSLAYNWDALTQRYGVQRRRAAVQTIDPVARTVDLSDGSVLGYDRLVVAPGVSFDDAYGLSQTDYETLTPHAWRAGAQTALLQRQIAAMTNGGVFVLTIPQAPYRCPPGPYERACLVADYLKTRKGRLCRVLVLDENPTIQAEADNFTRAFTSIHAGIIDYQPAVSAIAIDAQARRVRYTDVLGLAHEVQAQVINPIVPHRAAGSAPGGWLAHAGLANGAAGRWAAVDVRTYESTAVAGVHVIGDAAQCGMPKAGHVGNQEGKICADAIVRLMAGEMPETAPVANSACYSPITASTASWLTAVYQYDPTSRSMRVAANGGQTAAAKPTEASSISSKNFQQMNTWFNTLMADTFA